MIAAIIPARGGSKRLPGKNLARIGGSTLVELAIRCAQEVEEIDVIAVSTDCPDIAAEAFRCGVLVIPRPAELATDDATTESVVSHAVKSITAPNAISGMREGACIVLQPTSPLRTAQDVRWGLSDYQDAFTGMTVSVSRSGKNAPPNGAVYVLTMRDAAESTSWAKIPKSRFVMPADRSIDIDTAEDLARAQEWWCRRAVA